MANIERRTNGTYRARIRRNGAPDLSRTFDTEADASTSGRPRLRRPCVAGG